MTRAFTEDRNFEQVGSTDDFYTTGSASSVGEDPKSFSSALKNKEKIEMSFLVASHTRMLPNSSSIYYFNFTNKSWNIPSKASGNITGPFGQVAMLTGFSAGKNLGSNFVEDTLLFDFKGRSLASGSQHIFRAPDVYSNLGRSQKIREEAFDYSTPDSTLNFDKQGDLIARDFSRSCQRNEDFNASSDETFVLPVEYPFLVEKVVIEIPACMGPGWFNDRSSVTYMTSSYGDYTLAGVPSMGGLIDTFELIDQGGPCLTFALLSQKNYGSGSVRDIICKSTVNHENDLFDYSNIKVNQKFKGLDFSPLPNKDFYYMNTLGMSSDEIDCLVSHTSISGGNKYFTGSFFLKSTPSISNGCRVLNYSFMSGSPGESYVNFLNTKLSSPYIKARTTPLSPVDPMDPFTGYYPTEGFFYDEFFFLTGIDAFGRGMSGFSPSGGSIFGGEYVSIDKEKIAIDERVKNPFYVEDLSERSIVFNSISSSILTGRNYSTDNLSIETVSDLYLGKSKASPYLIYPGEKLVLSVSKTRPTHKNFRVNVSNAGNNRLFGIGNLISSSYYNPIPTNIQPGHDVQLATGSINITLYGSYVRAGNSYIP